MPWRLAVTAATVTAVATVWSATVGTGGVSARGFLLLLFVAGLPLLMRDVPTAFTCACLLVGILLLWVSLIGAAFGLGPVVAAALMLLAASVADPDNPPSSASVVLAGMLLLVFFLLAFCLYW
ncbi:hypothetical protein [Streptomyces erythrochromogenes]|uniref:hypothetical protein n=1 Tax=Streptomyces erythrochromogenes TaxID=285574 RepID=UPI0038290765